jgi:subtilisin family serine protease
MRRQSSRLAPALEPLEARILLAADMCNDEDEASDAVEIDVAAIGTRDAGSTLSTAYDLGQLGTSRSYSGSVGGRDLRDVMRFTLSSESTVTLSLTGLQADIDLGLYNASGQRLTISENAGSAAESIVTTLEAGTYYLAVLPWRRASSTYVLAAGAVAKPVDPPAQDPDDPTQPPTTSFPDVAYYGGANDWNLNSINAPEAWAQGYTGEGVVVAVVDTGVDVNHPDLLSQLWVNAGEIAGNGLDDDGNGFVDDVSGWDFSASDNNPDDVNGHGTHVAGTIAAASNGVGATGVAPDARIMPVRVLGDNGSGTAAAVAAGIRYAADNGADIINLSLGGSFSSVILSAIEYAMQLNVLVVAAAGNEYASAPGYPARFAASLSNVISVGAHSSSNAIASFSNDVGSSGAVQVDAPGVGVYSTYVDGRYTQLSGTSMATPHVAGLAALALSANPNLTAAQLRNLIVAGADRTISGSDSQGGINAAATVAMAAGGQTSASSATAAPTVSTSATYAAVRFIFSRSDAGFAPWLGASVAEDASESVDDWALVAPAVPEQVPSASSRALVAAVWADAGPLDEACFGEAEEADPDESGEYGWDGELETLMAV